MFLQKLSQKDICFCAKNLLTIMIIDIMITIRAIYYINVVKMYTLKAGGTCRREYYPC